MTNEEIEEKVLKEVWKEGKFLKKKIDEKVENMEKARKEYSKEIQLIYKNIKKQFKVSDSKFQEALDCGEPESLVDSWEDGLYKLQSKLEDKYKIFEIEHDDVMLILFDVIDGWSIKNQDGNIEITNEYIEEAIQKTCELKDAEIKRLQGELLSYRRPRGTSVINVREDERKKINAEWKKAVEEIKGITNVLGSHQRHLLIEEIDKILKKMEMKK